MTSNINTELVLPGYTMPEVHDRITQNPEILIIDVRPETAFDTGHLPRAMSRPAQDEEVFKKTVLDLDKQKEYLTYCGDGKFALKAAHYLQALGFENVTYAKEGYSEYASKYQTVSEQ